MGQEWIKLVSTRPGKTSGANSVFTGDEEDTPIHTRPVPAGRGNVRPSPYFSFTLHSSLWTGGYAWEPGVITMSLAGEPLHSRVFFSSSIISSRRDRLIFRWNTKSNFSGTITYGLEIVSVEPGGQTGHLLAEADSVGGTVVTLVVAGSDDGDEGKDHGHNHSGKLSETHDDERDVGWGWLGKGWGSVAG